MEKKQSFQQMVQGQLDIQVQKNKVGTLLHTIYKNYLKMDYKTKCKNQNYKTQKKTWA